MPIDRNKMKQHADSLKNSKYFKGKEGETYSTRLIDPGTGDPLETHAVHFVDGVGYFLCPMKEFKQPCAICNFVSKLYKDGYEQNAQLINKLKVKIRGYSVIYVREQADKGLQLFNYEGPTDQKKRSSMFDKLYEVCMDVDYGDVTDVETGHDITIKFIKQKTFVMPEFGKIAPKSTPLLTDRNKIEELLKNMPNIHESLTIKSSEEVKQILDSFLQGGVAETGNGDVSSEETQHYNGEEAPKEESKEKTVEQAFNELLEDK